MEEKQKRRLELGKYYHDLHVNFWEERGDWDGWMKTLSFPCKEAEKLKLIQNGMIAEKTKLIEEHLHRLVELKEM